MKNLLFLFMLCTVTAYTQTIGFNGQGSMDHSTWDDWDLLNEGNFNFITRQPGGADIKFLLTDDDGLVKGWDMSRDTIIKHYNTNGTDENDSEDGLEKYLRKYDEQERISISYEDKLINVAHYVPRMSVMYNFNVFYSGKQRCMNQLDSLISSGVNVPAVVFNNEVYSKGQYNFTFDEYRKDFEPYAILIKQKYPWIRVGLCMAPDIDRGSSIKWNNALFDYCAAHRDLIDAVDIHQYLNEDKLPLSWAAMPTTKQIINFEVKDLALANAWTIFYNEASMNTTFEDRVGYIHSRDPQIHIWCSEWNAKPMSKWSNTVSHGAWVFRTFMEDAHQYEYFMIHNGIGSDIGSMISQVQKQDAQSDTNAIRVQFYSYLFAGSLLAMDPDSVAEVGDLNIKEPGTYYGWYAQIRNDTTVIFPAVTIAGNLKIKGVTNAYIYGDFPYSSAGVLSLMSNQQPKTDVVKGIVVTDQLSMQPNSFGFFIINVASRDTIICRDTTVLDGYDITFSYDTIKNDKPWYCDRCNKSFYRWFHSRKCKECDGITDYIIKVSTDSVPVYKTEHICDTVEIGSIWPKTPEFEEIDCFEEEFLSIGSSTSEDFRLGGTLIPLIMSSSYIDKRRRN